MNRGEAREMVDQLMCLTAYLATPGYDSDTRRHAAEQKDVIVEEIIAWMVGGYDENVRQA